MSPWLGLAEPLLVLVGLIAFMAWQMRELNQRAKARKAESAKDSTPGS